MCGSVYIHNAGVCGLAASGPLEPELQVGVCEMSSVGVGTGT